MKSLFKLGVILIGLAILLAMVFLFNSIALATDQIGPMDKVKTMAMIKGTASKVADGRVYFYFVTKNEAKYTLGYHTDRKMISISKQTKNPDDKENYITGKRVTIFYDEKNNIFGFKVDELGTGSGDWSKMDWSTAWEMVYEWFREIEQ